MSHQMSQNVTLVTFCCAGGEASLRNPPTGHKYLRNKLSRRDVSSRRFFLWKENLSFSHFTQSGFWMPAEAGVVVEKESKYILAHTGLRELDGHPLGGCRSGFWFSARLYYPFGKGLGQHLFGALKTESVRTNETWNFSSTKSLSKLGWNIWTTRTNQPLKVRSTILCPFALFGFVLSFCVYAHVCIHV